MASPVLSNSPHSTSPHCAIGPMDHPHVTPFTVDSLVTSRESPNLISGQNHSHMDNSLHHHHSHHPHSHSHHPMNFGRSHSMYSGGSSGTSMSASSPYCGSGAIHYGIQQDELMNSCLSGNSAAAAAIAMTMTQPVIAVAASSDQYSRSWYNVANNNNNSSNNNNNSGDHQHSLHHEGGGGGGGSSISPVNSLTVASAFERHSSSELLEVCGSPCAPHIGFRGGSAYRSYYVNDCASQKY
jgi:hypothetical protein